MKKATTVYRAIFCLLATMLVVSACGKDTGTNSEPVATVSVTPSAPPMLVSFGETVTLSASAQAADGSGVTGKAFSWSTDAAGVATVDMTGVVTAVGNGTAIITASTDGVDGTATVTVQQAAAQVGFRAIAPGTVRATMASVEVEIQDANGNLVAGATDQIDISLGANPGNLVVHTSGIADNDRFIELVDPVVPVLLTPELSNNEGTDEFLAMEYDPATGLVWMTDRFSALSTLDVGTGLLTTIGTTDYIKGLTLDSSNGDLLAVLAFTDTLKTVDPATGNTTDVGQLLITGDSIEGLTGLDEDPTTGDLYGVAKLRDRANGKDRELVMINASTVTVTSVGTMSEDGVAGITFLTDGTLLAVTGDGATNSETLWTVDMTDASMTSLLVLGNGADGESIEAIPARMSGTMSAAAVGGVATFADLQIDGSGATFTLVGMAVGLSDGESAPFAIN